MRSFCRRLKIIVLLLCCSMIWVNVHPNVRVDEEEQDSELMGLSFEELMSVTVARDGKGLFVPNEWSQNLPKRRFGLIVPLSNFPRYATELIAAADSAANYINKNGGILGESLVILRGDDIADPTVAVNLANRMVDQYQVQALIGPIASLRTLRVAREVAIPKNIVMISPTASTNQLTELDDKQLVYRLIVNNQIQGQSIGEYLIQMGRGQQVVLIRDKSLYAEELDKFIEQTLIKHNGKIVDRLLLSRLVNYKAFDLSVSFASLSEQSIQSVVVIMPQQQAADVLTQFDRFWKKKLPLIVTADAIKPIPLEDAHLKNIEHCVSMVITESHDRSQGLFDEISRLIKQQASTFDSAYVYDAVILFAYAQIMSEFKKITLPEALTRLTSEGPRLSAKDFPNFLQMMTHSPVFSFYGASGRITFDGNGDNLSASLFFRPLKNRNRSLARCGRS